MGGNGEMYAQVVYVLPVVLSLYVNTRSLSGPFYIFPRQPRCRRANSDHAPWYSITTYCKKLCRAPELQQNVMRRRPKRVGEAEEEKRVAEKENKDMSRGREGVKGGEDVMMGSGA